MPKQGASLPAAVKANPPAPLAGAPPPPGTYTNFKKPKTTKAGKAGGPAGGGKPEKKDPTQVAKEKLEEDPDFAKYIKLLKMRVPIQNILLQVQ